MKTYDLTEEDINLLHYLKDKGDFIVHHSRPSHSLDEWMNIMDTECKSTYISDADSDEIVRRGQNLISVLQRYIPMALSSDPWIIEDPIQKAKLPVLKNNTDAHVYFIHKLNECRPA